MKKAQGLSMTTIIVAMLALIVLIVLVAIFTGKIGNFGSDIDTSVDMFKGKCVLPGTSRKCIEKDECISQNYGRSIGDYDCDTSTDQGNNPKTCCEYY